MTPEQISQHLELHTLELKQYIDTQLSAIHSRIDSGFPCGDPIEHRKVHEQYIKDAVERASLWKSIREKTITGIIWACLILLGTSLWEYLKTLVIH